MGGAGNWTKRGKLETLNFLGRNRDFEIATCPAKHLPVADAISKSRFPSGVARFALQ